MPRARMSDPDTSHEAAARASVNLISARDAVHVVLALEGAMTDAELVAAYRRKACAMPLAYPAQSESGIRTRRSELVSAGLVVATGEKRRVGTHGPAQVWAVAQASQAAA